MGQAGSNPSGGVGSQTAPSKPKGKLASKRAAELEQRKAERDAQKDLRQKEKDLKEEARRLIAQSRARNHSEVEEETPAQKKETGGKASSARAPPPAVAAPGVVGQEKRSRPNECETLAMAPEIAELMLDTHEASDCGGVDTAAIAAALAAAQAALLDDDVLDEDGTDDDDHEVDVHHNTSVGNRHGAGATTSAAKKKKTAKSGDDEENYEDISLHSSDFRDEELMNQLAELDMEVQENRHSEMRQLEESIAAQKSNALALMKAGNKPAALEELKKAKELEKRLAKLRDDVPSPPAAAA